MENKGGTGNTDGKMAGNQGEIKTWLGEPGPLRCLKICGISRSGGRLPPGSPPSLRNDPPGCIEWMGFREELKEGGLHSSPGLTKRRACSPKVKGETRRCRQKRESEGEGSPWHPQGSRGREGWAGIKLKTLRWFECKRRRGAWNPGEFRVLGG